jgi:hypothetical protein
VHAPTSYSYAILRVVPSVEREEFVNAGIVLVCEATDFLGAGIDLDEERLRAVAPAADLQLVRRHLDAVPRICGGGPDAGPIGSLSLRERWRWLTSPRSTILQPSAPHGGLCVDPAGELERLMNRLVRRSAREPR